MPRSLNCLSHSLATFLAKLVGFSGERLNKDPKSKRRRGLQSAWSCLERRRTQIEANFPLPLPLLFPAVGLRSRVSRRQRKRFLALVQKEIFDQLSISKCRKKIRDMVEANERTNELRFSPSPSCSLAFLAQRPQKEANLKVV